MAKVRQNKQTEQRIQQEIIVDAYGAEEQAMGWYYYLEEQLRFPFRAKCTGQRAISPLRKGQEIEVVGLAPAEGAPFALLAGSVQRWAVAQGCEPSRGSMH